MEILEMTDLEIYDLGIKELIEQIGPVYTERFLRQCKPNKYDYTAERHKWLANQPGIDEIVARIRRREAEEKEEECIKAERITAWRNGLLELTDIEIYELGLKVLADGLGAYGLLRFITQHFKQFSGDKPINLLQSPIENLRFLDGFDYSGFEERVSSMKNRPYYKTDSLEVSFMFPRNQ